MFTIKQPKILFFTAGYNPTEAEAKAAAALGVPVQWRNAMFADSDKETCDGVAGVITKNYTDMPSAADAIAKYKNQFGETATLVDNAAGIDVNNPNKEDDTVEAPETWKPNK